MVSEAVATVSARGRKAIRLRDDQAKDPLLWRIDVHLP
jgi:hypothetical protein